MYRIFKNIITSIIPKKTIYAIEPALRTVFSLTKKGTNHLCTICNFKNKNWIELENHDLLCPKCGSLARDRRLWKLIKDNYLKENTAVLEFSPSRSLYRNWKKQKNTTYTASDLSDNFIADVQFDITKIPVNDSIYDLVICYHILEHVIEDEKAMKELYRIVKPNGNVIIQTPFKEGEIYEDYTIISENNRLKHFGQEDHVRMYSVASLKERLENCTFKVENKIFKKDIFLGLVDEHILIAKK